MLRGFGLIFGESLLFFFIDGLFWDLVNFLNFRLFEFFVIDNVFRLMVSFLLEVLCEIFFFFIDWLFGVFWISFFRNVWWFLFDLVFDKCFFGLFEKDVLLWFEEVLDSFFNKDGLLDVCVLLFFVFWGFLFSEYELLIIEFEFEVMILCIFLLGMFKILVLLFWLWFNMILLLFIFCWLWNCYSLLCDGVCFILVVCL